MTLSERISLLKNQSKMTTDTLAKLSGVPKGTINKILNGETKNPTGKTLRRLAIALGCLPGDLYPSESAPMMLREGDQTRPALGNMFTAKIPVYGDYSLDPRALFSFPEDSCIICDFVVVAEDSCPVDSRIAPGDYVFIRACDSVPDGDIAAVEIDGSMFLARIFAMNSGATLLVERGGMAPALFSQREKKRLRILGRAIGFQSRL